MVALSKEAGRFYDVLMGIPFAVRMGFLVVGIVQETNSEPLSYSAYGADVPPRPKCF